jgi:NodT family efflux transporter outer membrane factor (OMF) lipoprotein
LICLLLIAGCAVGPDFRAPSPDLPPAWKGAAATEQAPMSATEPEPLTLLEWWESFNDATLSSLIERAIRSNPDIRQAGARIRQARAARGVGAAALWPAIDSSAEYRRSGSGGSSSGSGAAADGGDGSNSDSGARGGDRDLFQTGLDAAWELDLFGGTRRSVEALSADLRAAAEDRRDVLVILVAEVGINYMDLRGLQQQIAIAEENLQSQRKTADITRRRFEAGFVSGLDVANANAQAATTASQIPVLESGARGAIYNISVLLGREPTALVEELDTETPIPVTPPRVPVGLPSDLVRRRPDIRRAEARIHAATARIGVATADLFPRFSLTGSLNFSATDVGSLAKWSSASWSMGPSLQWPIFDAGRIRWNIEVQNALQEQSLIAYEQTILTALKDVETALMAYAKEQEHNVLLEDAVVNNRKAVDLAMELYTGGQTDFLNVLTAQRSLYTSEDALVQSTRTLAVNLVALYKALGGGWEATLGEVIR